MTQAARNKHSVRDWGMLGHPMTRGHVLFIGEITNQPGLGIFAICSRPDTDYAQIVFGHPIDEFEEVVFDE